MKKVIIIFTAVLLLILLVGCNSGEVTSETKITNTDGAGTRVINVKLSLDAGLKRDGKAVEDNSKYLIGGNDAVLAKLKEVCALDDAVIEFTERTDEYDILTISYSFDSIEEYNEKTKIFAGEGAEIEPATLTVDGDQVTFSEPGTNLANSIVWGKEAVYNDPEIYDDNDDENVTLDSLTKIYEVSVTIGDTKEEYAYDSAIPDTLEATGVVSAAGDPVNESPTNVSSVEESPQTSDNGSLYLLLIAVLTGLTTLLGRKKVLN